MSAIWGMIHFNREAAKEETGSRMESAMKPYKIDSFVTKTKSNVIMGCGVQYITLESRKEQLPRFDEERSIYYTADCMIDNKDQLMKLLFLVDKGIPDGELLYRAYERWGERFVKYVIGIFAFVLYEKEKNRCVVFTDHTGSRCIYYCVVKETLCFGTIVAPILEAIPKGIVKLDEKWITACEATYSPDMIIFNGLTPFKEIYQLEAGHYMIFESIGTVEKSNAITAKKICYWNPRKNKKKISLGSQEAYKELFLQIFRTSISSMLRSEGNTAITLSSGLDSSAIACLAAPMLEKEKKKLYSFTSVPVPEYIGTLDSYFISNESQGVLKICEEYPTIIPEFVDCIGQNAFTQMKRLVGLMELPYKTVQNLIWLDKIYEGAAKKNCRIVLKGQYGNATISYGAILTRFYDDLCHFKWKSGFKELKQFCKKNQVPGKKVLKRVILEMKNKSSPSCESFENTMVRRELLDKYHIQDELKKILKESGGTFMDSRRQRKQFMYYLQGLSQLGAFDTRLGLIHGIIIRDPTKDKRMIELCSSLPMECCVHCGVERAMIREYMRGIIPDAILDVVKHRGIQSADFATRICNDWGSIGKEVLEMLHNPRLLDYIEEDKLDQLRDRLGRGPLPEQEIEITQAMILCSCSVFLDKYGE